MKTDRDGMIDCLSYFPDEKEYFILARFVMAMKLDDNDKLTNPEKLEQAKNFITRQRLKELKEAMNR